MSKRSRRESLRRDPDSAAARMTLGPSRARGTRPTGGRPPRRGAQRSTVRRFALPALLGAAAIAAVFIIIGGTGSTPATASELPAKRAVLGQADAPILIREYGDFQCPSCGAFFRVIEPQIRAAYIDTGIAKLEWHDFAWIGQESRNAANAARCAGDQGKFWEYHDLLYNSQAGENQGAFSGARLKAMGASLSLEPVAFDACVDGNAHAGAVQDDFSDVRSKGFNSTPTFLVGSLRLVGAQPFEIFQQAIASELGN